MGYFCKGQVKLISYTKVILKMEQSWHDFLNESQKCILKKKYYFAVGPHIIGSQPHKNFQGIFNYLLDPLSGVALKHTV